MTQAGPLLLAFETATPASSVALLRGEALVAETSGSPERTAAEGVLPALDELLAGTDQPLASIEAFAISIGPGSFTGLRVGLATVKGLAFGTPRLVASVPTLAALARGAPEGEGPIVATLDARRGELYAAAYDPEGLRAAPQLPESVYTFDELAARLPTPCRLVGEGVALCGDALRARCGAGVALASPAQPPRARHVGVLGARLLAAGSGVDAAELVPRYVRRAEAEAQRTGQRFD